MNLKLLSLSITFLALAACQYGYRKPSSAEGPLNLNSEIEKILMDIENPSKFNVETCAGYIQDVYNDVLALSPTRFNINSTKENWQAIYNNLWIARVKLRDRLIEFAAQKPVNDSQLISCTKELRDGFRLSRWIEDYLAETFSGVPQEFKAGEPKFVLKDNFKLTALRGEAPWMVVNPKVGKTTLRSGDLIISRGNAYTSSAIARIADIDSQFSHMAFIFIPGESTGREYTIDEAIAAGPHVLVLEAHIEVGSTIRPFKEYIEDGNARNVIFRYKANQDPSIDASIAHRAAKWSYEYIQGYRKKSFDANPLFAADDVNHNVPYNFQMGLENPENPKKLFCSQVSYVGFKNNKVTIPQYSSTLNLKLSLVKRMGITTPVLFAPGDMEVDPRFEMIAEYRNIRKMKGLRMKDMALSSMYRWMEQGYELTPLLPTMAKSLIAWTLRQADARLFDIKKQLPKNMNTKILNTTFTLEKIAMYLETELEKAEAQFKKDNSGMPMSFRQGLEVLEKIRQQDQELWVSRKTSKFHDDFRPPTLSREPQ